MTAYAYQQINSVDANFSVLRRIGDVFAPHAQSFPSMTVGLDAGHVLNGTTLTEVVPQNTSTITAPVTNPRIDRVVVDQTTGVVSVVAGSEATNPVPPAIPSGKYPVAQVLLLITTTAITSDMITDERVTFSSGSGSGGSAMLVSLQTGTSYTYTASDAGYLKRRSNSGTVMTDTLPGTSPGVMAAGWVVTIANNDASALMSIAAGSGAVINGAQQGFIILGPNQEVTIASDGTNYNVAQAPARTRLAANTTLYVSTSGSDSYTGLTSGTAFLTIQKAVNVVANYFDLSGFILTVQLADGTYTSGFTVSTPWVGGHYGNIIINGNSSTPSNVLISANPSLALALSLGAGTGFTIQNLKLQTSSSGGGIRAGDGAEIAYGNIIFGACNTTHITASSSSRVVCIANYSIVGGGTYHFLAASSSEIRIPSTVTITLTGTPAFSTYFVQSVVCCYVECLGTFSGAATGTRYLVNSNAVIFVNNAGANYFPGNAAGSNPNGGIYS